MLFSNIADGYILVANAPNITLPAGSIEAAAIQLATFGMTFAFVITLIVGVVAVAMNMTELFFPVVMAKHRIKQLVLNRAASGLALANAFNAIASLIDYVSRRKSVISSASVDGYNAVLAFWVLLLFASLFQLLCHRLTPNEHKRRFDHMYDEFETMNASPESRQPDAGSYH